MTPFSVCHQIARKNGSPLFLVSRLLGTRKRQLFLAAYATMRIIDDLVDDAFLPLDNAQRHARRATTLEQIERWRTHVLTALDGCLVPEPDAPDAPIFQALMVTAGHSNLGAWPWNALADAMVHDVQEQEILTWEDFRHYCEGATVSPATTFAYILACEVRDGRYVLDQPPEFCRQRVHAMAIFCYLIHMARDLAKDVCKPPQLITIPRTVLAACGLQRDTLGATLQSDKRALAPLIEALLAEARTLLPPGMAAIQTLPLRPLEQMILNRLLKKYRTLFDQLTTDPMRFL
ncbi:MAG: squalene/phytoene synthase family protein [Magnetococcales bacterium]|nr:squalene/phytoene synthase family protein [Magnetococcales bacterium]